MPIDRISTSVETTVCSIAAPVQTILDSVAATVEALLDAIALAVRPFGATLARIVGKGLAGQQRQPHSQQN
jgi:hypothetical protein